MRNWIILFCIFLTTSVFARCNIDQQRFGVSSNTIENSLENFKAFDRIPDVQKQIITMFDEICPNEGGFTHGNPTPICRNKYWQAL